MKHKFVALWSLLLFCLSLWVAFDRFYIFTLPFTVLSFLTFLIAIPSKSKAAFWRISVITFSLLVVPWLYASFLWPSGDDGPGMRWGIMIGGGTLAATVFGFFNLMSYLAKKFKVRQL